MPTPHYDTHSVTIVLLAGGRATRFPGKLSHVFASEPLLVRVFRRLTRTGRPCIISVREPLPGDMAHELGAPTVSDIYDDAGPLGGLASAAAHVRTPLLFAAAGDLINIDASIVDRLELRHRQDASRGVAPDAVIPRHENGDVEPLAALYDTARLLSSARMALALGRKKVTSLLEGLRVAFYDISPSEIETFRNVNTADDLAEIRPL